MTPTHKRLVGVSLLYGTSVLATLWILNSKVVGLLPVPSDLVRVSLLCTAGIALTAGFVLVRGIQLVPDGTRGRSALISSVLGPGAIAWLVGGWLGLVWGMCATFQSFTIRGVAIISGVALLVPLHLRLEHRLKRGSQALMNGAGRGGDGPAERLGT